MVKIKAVILIISLITFLFAMPINAAETPLSYYLTSVDVLNNGRPFGTSAPYLLSGSRKVMATARYMTGTSMAGAFHFRGTINPPTGTHVVYARQGLSTPIWLVVGYSYRVTFKMTSQLFDDNDVRFDPSEMNLRFAYVGTNDAFYTAAVPVSVVPNSMDGYDVTFDFTMSKFDSTSTANPVPNYFPDFGVAGSYNYNYIDFRFTLPSDFFAPLQCQYYIEDFHIERSDGDVYNAMVIENLPDQIAQNILDKEKEEAETGANDAVNDLTNAIDDNSGGFIDALDTLVSAMSYTGTESAWTFPAISLPKIDGVIQETQLIGEQPIDFGIWVEKIPSGLLTVVRSLTTIGLIVFCFKELWSTVSYLFTLKGGGSDG